MVNFHVALDPTTLTNVGVSLSRTNAGIKSFHFRCGLTPPGDEQIEIYHVLTSGLLSPGDGANWSGSLRFRDDLFLVLNYIARFPVFIYLTWSTTS